MVQNIEQNTSKNEMNCALFETKNPEIALIVLHVHVKVTYNIVILYFEGGECVKISHWNNNVFLRIILREKIECFAITSNKTSIKKKNIYIYLKQCAWLQIFKMIKRSKKNMILLMKMKITEQYI